MAKSTTGEGLPAAQTVAEAAADHRLFKRGRVTGITHSPASSTSGATPSAPQPQKEGPEELPSPMPEEPSSLEQDRRLPDLIVDAQINGGCRD
jgi:hypothetical protein